MSSPYFTFLNFSCPMSKIETYFRRDLKFITDKRGIIERITMLQWKSI